MKHAMAVHEAGKALMASVLRQRTGRLERVERVSMVPRGRCVSFGHWTAVTRTQLIVVEERCTRRLNRPTTDHGLAVAVLLEAMDRSGLLGGYRACGKRIVALAA